jgi:hypothetical protein
MERPSSRADEVGLDQQHDNSEAANSNMEQDVYAKQEGIFSSGTSEMPA